MLHRMLLAPIAFAVLCLGSATMVSAVPVVFNDRASFTAATTGNTIITFNGVAPANGFVFFGSTTMGGGTFMSSGVTFQAPATGAGENELYVVDEGLDPNLYNTGAASNGGVLSVQFGDEADDFLPRFTVTLPGAFTAIGFDTNTFDSAIVELTLSNGDVVMFSTIGTAGRFFGFTTTVGITSLVIRETFQAGVDSAGINLDDFTFGQAVGAPIPEPATILLLSTGLAGAAIKSRRRRKAPRH